VLVLVLVHLLVLVLVEIRLRHWLPPRPGKEKKPLLSRSSGYHGVLFVGFIVNYNNYLQK
jgi:hypothetical protein